MAIFSNKDDIKDALNAAEKHFKPYFEPLAEFERIARNKPHPNVIKAKLPNVTDGTLAAVIQAQPRRVIQQLPTGRVTSIDQPELSSIADFIWNKQIIPNANTSGDVLQKSWIAMTKALTYGAQPAYVFFNNSGEYYGADFVLPYIKDVMPEPGKLYANDSEYIFMNSWWTKAQIQTLIDREKQLKSNAKDRGAKAQADLQTAVDQAKKKADKETAQAAYDDYQPETYESGWNLTAMSDLLNALSRKPEENKSPAENKDQTGSYARIVHVFQRGVGANFYSYSPKLDKIVRTKANPDPRGCLPIHYLYANIDLSNPLGRGSIELSGGMQNLLDSEVQSYQLNRLLGTAPPLKKWGSSIVNSTVKLKPNAVWDMGGPKTAGNDIEPVELSTDAVRSFPTNYGLMKSQILNLTGNQDTSVSGSASANTNQSKTPQGVALQQTRINIDDNYMRKQFETFFEGLAETMLNIQFAESSGVREIELTEEFLEKQLDKEEDGPDDQGAVTIDPVKKLATITYDDIKTKLKFQVNPTSTRTTDDQEQANTLLQMLQEAGQNRLVSWYLGQDGYKLHIGEAYRQLFQRLGLENMDDIVTKMSPQEKQQAQQSPFPIIDPPTIRLTGQVPNAAMPAALASGGVNVDPRTGQAMQEQVDLGDILKDPQTGPNAKAQIQQMAGIQPDVIAAAPMAQPGAQPGAPGQPPQGQPPAQPPAQPPQQGQPPQLAPEDQQVLQKFADAGFTPQQAIEALTMMHHGYSHDQIMKVLSQAHGAAA